MKKLLSLSLAIFIAVFLNAVNAQDLDEILDEHFSFAGQQLKQAKTQTDMEGELYNWKEKGHKAEYMGTEDVEGTETYKIKITKKDGDVVLYFIDTDSYIILKETRKVTMQGQEMEVESYPGNYEMIDGVAFPMSVRTITMGQETEVSFDSIKFDLEMDDSIFARPVEEEAEVEEDSK